MSASMNSTAWKREIDCPNCTRSSANARESSSARAEAPIVRAPIIAARRAEVLLLLFLRRGRERDRRPPGDVPERAGRSAPLLLHEHLLEEGEALPSVRDRMVDRVEALVEGRPLRARVALRGERAVRLALLLEWG